MRVAGPLLQNRVAQSQKRLHHLILGFLLLFEIFMLTTSQSCPEKCVCSTPTVKCVNQNLTAIPSSLPANVKNLFITGNNISRLTADSFPVVLDQLTDLYLTGNKMEQIDSNAFTNLPKLRLLDLSNNRLRKFSPEAFLVNNNIQDLNLSSSLYNYSWIIDISTLLLNRTHQLSVLDLSNNELIYLPENMFSNLHNLSKLDLRNNSIVSVNNITVRNLHAQSLDLRDNSLTRLHNATLAELSLQPSLRVLLAGNPWTCDCDIEDMALWLRRTELVTDRQNLTCASPDKLRNVHLLQVNMSQLPCTIPKDMKSVLETSYVFLGMVLALIGVIFLLVLYLNRKGIKRWMYNIRDACRDHMEGYHYRYEINSDPRLANLSLNSDV